MRRVVLLSSLVFFAACTKAVKSESVFDADRLNKLNKMSVLQERRQEEEKLNKILWEAKRAKAKSELKSYPLPKPPTEENIYAQLLNAYQSRDLNAVDYYANEFVKRYPKSVFGDNALYLNGQLKLMMGLPSESLREFERAVKQFPLGNKRAASLLGKGIAYRKLKLNDYAQRVFDEVKKDFPGSPESYRVELEEKLLSAAKE